MNPTAITMNRIAKFAKASAATATRIAGATAIAALVFGSLASAQVSAEAGQDSRTVNLTVYNHAHVSQNTLRDAQGEASRILRIAGLHARWLDCSPTNAEAACNSTQTNAYTLRLLAGSTGVSPETSDTLGNVANRTPTTRTASIFYDRVRELAGGNTAPSGILLGRVIAREVGMLLLGPKTSSNTGIMQARWSEQQLSLIGDSDVLFTSLQARAMRARLAQQAAPSVSVAALNKPSR